MKISGMNNWWSYQVWTSDEAIRYEQVMKISGKEQVV